jgi:oxygen-dependent protoporphyrinogen oxidase
MAPRIVIVGAGISGLATAFYLQQQRPDAEITILEISQYAGGLIRTHQKENYLVEHGPACINSDHQHTMKLCHQLGILDRLCEPKINAKTIIHDGDLIQYGTNPKKVSRCLPLRSVVRSRLERFLPRRRSQKEESLWHFARRRYGSAFANFFADAAATEFFAGDPKLLSVRSSFPDLTLAERQFGSVSRGFTKLKQSRTPDQSVEPELFPSRNTHPRAFQEGMRILPETLSSKLKQSPCLGVGVQRVVANQTGSSAAWTIQGEKDQSWSADVVILTPPAPRLAAMLAELDGDLSDALLTIPHAPLVVLNLAYSTKHLRRPTDWSTLVVPQKYKRNLLYAEFPSVLFSDRAPADHILLRILSGGWHRQEMLNWDEGALLLLVRAELGKFLGINKPPAFVNIALLPTAIPQMTLGHSERLANINRITQRHSGLFLAGQAFWGTSVNDGVAGAGLLGKQVFEYLSSRLS